MTLVATQVKRRRGTTAENDAFTGAEGEIVVDTERHELRVHDGVTQGGFKIGGGSGALVVGQILEVVGTADYTPEGCLLADGAEYTKAQFPDLWENFLTGTPKLQTCTYTEYANQIAEYGFCNKFAVDTTNETFKVPTRNKYRKLVKKIVNGTTWANLYDDGWCEQGGYLTADTSGAVQAVALPIEMSGNNYQTLKTLSRCATTPNGFNWGYFSDKASTDPSNTSATAYFSVPSTSYCIGAWWQVNGYATIPDSTANITREFVVVANGTLNQEQMDWSAWASSLAGRATTDMNNITSTGKETVVGWGVPDYTAGISKSGETTYTAESAGEVRVAYWSASYGRYRATVNGNSVLLATSAVNSGMGAGYNSEGYFVSTFNVNKGDVWSITKIADRASELRIMFYPMKGVRS